MLASIISESSVTYPTGEAWFSPRTRYPEYPFEHLADQPNAVYDLVRSSLREAGLDSTNFGKPSWNPLGEYVKQDSRVFVLCNFVHHKRINEDIQSLFAKCTHGSVLRPVIDYLLIAVGSHGRITFGNAPLQSCDWRLVLEQTGAARVLEFYRAEGIEIEARDLRSLAVQKSLAGRELTRSYKDKPEATATITLTDASELSTLCDDSHRFPVKFRVADYNPVVTESSHINGHHKYIISKAFLDSDVVVSIPKLKTHEKVGITCGLKGFVGIVASKDCLAHHRFGGSDAGGDEYAGVSRARSMLSRYHDWVQGLARDKTSRNLHLIIDRNLRRILKAVGSTQAGAWHGNDTCWRMALDLARIAHFADVEGIMRKSSMRRHLMFVDGVIAGEGNGPLSPRPVAAGAVLFCDNVALGDRVVSELMGFDPDRVSLIREALRAHQFPLVKCAPMSASIIWNTKKEKLGAIPTLLQRPFLPPDGWKGQVERAARCR